MKKHLTANVYMTGSKTHVNRVIWVKGGKAFIKWYGQLVEVYNTQGESIPSISSCWRTVESY